MITLTVNDQQHQLDVDPATPLLYILRGELGLNGAKFGCGLGQCGACTVIVDGEAVFSCPGPGDRAARSKDHHDRGAPHREQPQSLATRLHRGAGRAMRLLHRRNDHACTSPARANTGAVGRADPGAYGAESLSLWNPYAHPACDPARQ